MVTFQEQQKSRAEAEAEQRGLNIGNTAASQQIQSLLDKIGMGLFNDPASINKRIEELGREKTDIFAANKPATNIRDKAAQAARNTQLQASLQQVAKGIDERIKILQDRLISTTKRPELESTAAAPPTTPAPQNTEQKSSLLIPALLIGGLFVLG